MNYFLQAALHLRHVLELKPNYGPALSALADMEAIPDTSVHLYTVVIIVFLVAAVLIWVLSTLDYGVEEMLGIRCVYITNANAPCPIRRMWKIGKDE